MTLVYEGGGAAIFSHCRFSMWLGASRVDTDKQARCRIDLRMVGIASKSGGGRIEYLRACQ